jgi:hypothetical protein
VELGRFSIEKDTIVISDDGDGYCALTDYACPITGFLINRRKLDR